MHVLLLEMVKRFLLFTGTVLLFVACSKSGSNTSACDPNVSFSATVKPILHQYCSDAGCHDDVFRPVLDVYITAHDGSAQISQAVSSGRMPLGKTLSAAQRSAITCWVSNGAKNN